MIQITLNIGPKCVETIWNSLEQFDKVLWLAFQILLFFSFFPFLRLYLLRLQGIKLCDWSSTLWRVNQWNILQRTDSIFKNRIFHVQLNFNFILCFMSMVLFTVKWKRLTESVQLTNLMCSWAWFLNPFLANVTI